MGFDCRRTASGIGNARGSGIGNAGDSDIGNLRGSRLAGLVPEAGHIPAFDEGVA